MSKRNSKLDALRSLAGHNSDQKNKTIPTGHSELDFYISRGIYEDEHGEAIEYDEEILYGIPTGKLVMFYGGEGCGKSSLAYRVCGNAQQLDMPVFWIDCENSFSPQLSKINGMDPDNIALQNMYDVNDPERIFDAETILDTVMKACKKGAGVVVVDSVAHLIPRYVMENPADKDTVAILARVLGKTLPKIAGYAAANGTLVIFINQLRVNPGMSFGNPEGTTGGNAIKHASSIILKMNKLSSKDSFHYVEDESGKESLIAGTSNVWIEKNRFASPHREGVKVPIYYKYYFPNSEEVIFDYGRKTKVISVRLGVYSWNNIKVEGKKAFMKDDVVVNSMSDLVAEIIEAAEGSHIPLPPEIINYEKHVTFTDNNVVQKGVEEPDFDPDKAKKKVAKKKKTSTKKKAPVVRKENVDL